MYNYARAVHSGLIQHGTNDGSAMPYPMLAVVSSIITAKQFQHA